MSPNRKESQIPVGTQFSPELIDLMAFVKMVVKFSGDIEKLRNAVVEAPVRIKPYDSAPTERMRNLPLEAGVQYGILTKGTYHATELAKELAELKEPDLFEIFARHILLKLNGLRVVEAAQEMFQDGRDITGDTLSLYLTDQGFRVTVHNTAINTMRMWLAQAGLFPKGKSKSEAWIPNKAVKEKLLGMNDELIAALSGFSKEQISYVKVLCSLEPKDWIAASDVRDMAETNYGVRFGRASLPKEVLEPLKQAGLIEYETRGTKSGKTSRLKVTNKFNSTILKTFIDSTLKSLNNVVTAYYLERPEDIFESLHSKDKYIKGRSLEALTIYIMRLLGLRFIEWRKRAKETGYSEVDVLLAGLFGGLPTTWQVQCKNTPTASVTLEDVAKEVGLLLLTNATHILIVANASFTDDARKFARAIMLKSSVNIFLLDKNDFNSIKENPANIAIIIKTHAEDICNLRIKNPVWGGTEQDKKSALKHIQPTLF